MRDLQDLVRERHASERQTDVPQLRTVKEWIAADFETWEKVLNAKGTELPSVSGGEEKKKVFKKR
jgi:hypothetical protein